MLLSPGEIYAETTEPTKPTKPTKATKVTPAAQADYLKQGVAETTPEAQADYLKQGVANLEEENYEEAIVDLKRARDNDPDSSAAAYYLGTAYKKAQNYSEARTQFKDALTLKPPVKEAVIALANTSYQLGNMDEALATLEIAESEGIEPAQTAFLKGLVFLKSSKNIEAIDSFNKAKSLDNKLATSADYQIGVASLQEGKLSEAKEIFKEIVIRDPNADIAQFANQYIASITKRLKEERPFRARIGLMHQHDDNVLLKPGDSAAATSITNEADSAAIYTLMGEYTPKLKGPYGIKAQYSLYINDLKNLDSHDIQSHAVALVPSYNLKNGSISLLASGNYTLVEDDKYLRTYTLSPAYTFTLTGNKFAQAFARYRQQDYLKTPIHDDENRDGNEYGIGASWFYLIAESKGFINARYEFNKENTKGQNWRYNGNKLGLSFLYPLADRLKFNVSGEAYLQNYEKTHTTFNKKRNDNTYTFNTMLSYNFYDDMDIQLQYSYIRGASNIADYGYDKYIVATGVAARF